MPLISLAMLMSILVARGWEASVASDEKEHSSLYLMLLFVGVAALSRIMMAHAAVVFEDTRDRRSSWLTAHRHRTLLEWSWILASPLLLLHLSWGKTVDAIQSSVGLTQSYLVEVFSWGLPTALLVMLLDVTTFELDCYLAKHRTGQAHKGLLPFLVFFWNRAKPTWLPIAIATLILCGLIDLAHAFVEDANSLIVRCGIPLIFVLLGILAMPDLLRVCWNCRELPENEKTDTLREVWEKLGNSRRELILWPTQNRIANCLVVGVLPWRRRVLISDRLLGSLKLPELEMILCHEAAHIQKNHSLLRALPWFISLLLILIARIASSNDSALEGWMTDHKWITSLVLLGQGLSILAISCLLSRWTEKDADRFAVVLATRHQVGISGEDGLIAKGPADNLVAALEATSPPNQRSTTSWLYPSVSQRRKAIHQSFPLSSESK